MSELEENIRGSVTFASVTASGFHEIKCPICNDHKVRGGFRFDSDKIGYHCFRGSCDASTQFIFGEQMSRRFKNLMEELDVEIPIEDLINKKKAVPLSSVYEKHSYTELNLPKNCVSYNPDKHWWFANLLEERYVDFRRDLFVGTCDEWKHKLIIPCYHKEKLIGWQGISSFKGGKTFYLTSSGNSDIMFINNHDGHIVKRPVIVEGIMDACAIPNSIAIFRNSISKKQAYILRNSNPILLPDRKGSNFIENARRFGWDVSIPAWKEKDINDAVQRLGKFVSAKMVFDGIRDDMTKAEVAYNMWKFK